MGKHCCISDCKSKHGDPVGFFLTPVDQALLDIWMDKLRAGLPPNFTLSNGQRREVCGLHFDSSSIRTTGNVKKLVYGAVPNLIISSSSSGRTYSSHSSAPTSAQIIISLRAKVKRLEEQLAKFKRDPPASFIKNHRHKLASFMDRDAFIIFNNAIINH